MAGLNKISIIGNVGKDPEARYTQSGTMICNFTVAVNRKTKRQGELVEETDWFRVVAFDKLADIVTQYLQKGKQVYVDGRVSLNQWTDKATGEERASLEITASNVIMLGSRSDPHEGEDEGGDIPF